MAKSARAKPTLSEILGFYYQGLISNLLHAIQPQQLEENEVYLIIQRSSDVRAAPWYDLVIGQLVNTDISIHKRRTPAGRYKSVGAFYKLEPSAVVYGILTSVVRNGKELISIHPSRVVIRKKITTAIMTVVSI